MSLFRKKDIAAMLASNPKVKGLKKTLTAFDLLLIGIGTLVGTGIFVLVGTGAVTAGPALSVSFILAGLASTLVALCYAEFASSMPVSGSIYTYCYTTLGEVVAWIIGWILMLEYGVAVSAVAVGWSGYFQSIISQLGIVIPKALGAAPGTTEGVDTIMNLPALIIVLAVTWLLSLGIRESVRINNILVIVKIAVLILVISVGAIYVKTDNWVPFAPGGIEGITAAAAITFFVFIGFDAVSSAAEEVKNPQRDLPIGIIGSLIICILLYVLVALVMTGMVPFQNFAGVGNPLSMAFKSVNQNWIAVVVDVSAVVAIIPIIIVMAYGQIRLIFAMARDGLLPEFFAKVDTKSSTPVRATVLVGVVFGLLAAFVPFDKLAELVNIGTLTAFGAVAVAVIILRQTLPNLHRPFRCPGMPYLPLIALFSCIFLMFQLNFHTWIAYFTWIAIGVLIYFVYSKNHSKLNK